MLSMYETAKNLFELPSKKGGEMPIDLRCLTHGVPPKAVKNNLNSFFQEWAFNGVDAWNQVTVNPEIFLVGDEDEKEREKPIGWWNLPEIIGDRFISRLLNAPQGTCIMLPNATQIVFGILSCKELNAAERRKVICTDGEFPAVLHTVQNFNKQFEGYADEVRRAVQLDIVVVEMGNEPFDAKKILDHIDEMTALVIFSHVGFVRGERVPDAVIQTIAKRCHEKGALVAIDGYHAIGAHRIDVQALNVDFYFGGLLKEGCGSSGSCFLYIRSGLNVHPALTGWFADKQPFAFAQSPEPHSSVRRRFLTGTTPVASLYHGIEGLKIMLQFGLDNVAEDILQKVQSMVSILRGGGVTVVSPLERESMSAMIVLKVEEADKLREYLSTHEDVLTDARRNQYLRLAPHIYNSPVEVELAAQKIVQCYVDMSYKSVDLGHKKGPVT